MPTTTAFVPPTTTAFVPPSTITEAPSNKTTAGLSSTLSCILSMLLCWSFLAYTNYQSSGFNAVTIMFIICVTCNILSVCTTVFSYASSK
jgi:hypothetical protein